MQDLAVIDFETTGLTPGIDRPTEVAIVIVRGREVVDAFSRLMNPGISIPPEVESLTGITNAMVAAAPSVGQVMTEALRFVGGRQMVSHNAAFDAAFWTHELARIGIAATNPFLCTLRLARRVYPQLSRHGLQALRESLQLVGEGRAHRAEADALLTVELLGRIRADLAARYGLRVVTAELLELVQSTPRGRVDDALRAHGAAADGKGGD